MTINTIIASVLGAVQFAVDAKRLATDDIVGAATNWEDEARAILAGIPVSEEIDLATYLVEKKGYEVDALSSAGAAIAVMEPGSALASALANGGSLDEYAGTQPDTEIVQYIVSRMNLQPKPPQAQGTPMTQQPTPAVAIDPSMVGAINALLASATKGQLTDLSLILGEKIALEGQLQQARQDLTTALMKAKNTPMVTTGTTPTPIGDLTYDVVMRKASDVFPIANGKATGQGLSFEIPTLEWKDAAGNLVDHPETPAHDPNYDFDGVKLLLSLTAINRGMNQWLYGHTGTGKTTFIEQVCSRMGWPVSRINLDSNLERADLVGHITLAEENGTTVSKYEEGILPRAMQRPGIFLMDEFDAGRPDILFVVQRALENKGLMLTEDNGRIIAPHPLFRFVATANTRGQGDEYGMYAGTRTMNASMIDRFTAFIEFHYMKADREAALIQSLVPAIDPAMATKMANFATEIRTAFSKGEVYNTISPRGLTVLADCYATFSGLGTPANTALQLSMDMSILNKVTNDTRQKFIELASRVFGITVK